MPPQDPAGSHEIPQDTVEIRQDAAITIQDALSIARDEACPIGKSTLQRWAKVWADRGDASQVKSILVTNRTGSFYRLDRDDFRAWLFDQKQNMRSDGIVSDPMMPHETPRDITRPQQTSRDTERPREVSSDDMEIGVLQKLRDENMQLKIDVEVRKQLLNQAAGEINRQRDHIEGLLRENGGLQTRLLQLSAPATPNQVDLPSPPSGSGPIPAYPQEQVNNSAPLGDAAL